MTPTASAAVLRGYRGAPLTASTRTTPPTRSAAEAASVNCWTARSSCSSGVESASRLPYRALKLRQPNCSPMPTVTSTLSRNSGARAGQDASPRSPPGMSPAKKFRPTSRTSASCTALTKESTSRSAGTATSKGHQSSAASNPADVAAPGRSCSGSSVNRMDRLTSKLVMQTHPSSFRMADTLGRDTGNCQVEERAIRVAARTLALPADVDVVGLVDEVEAALAVADQVGEEPDQTVAEPLLAVAEPLLAGGVAVGGLPEPGHRCVDRAGDGGVLAGEAVDHVRHPGRVLQDLFVDTARSLGDLDMDGPHRLQVLEHRGEAGRPVGCPAQRGHGERVFEVVERSTQAEPRSLGSFEGAGRCLIDLPNLHARHRGSLREHRTDGNGSLRQN